MALLKLKMLLYICSLCKILIVASVFDKNDCPSEKVDLKM
jgi:hypothetical protein